MKVLWVARAPAPYRYPVWCSLAEMHSLRVGFLHERGLARDWKVLPSDSFEQFVFRATGLPYREDALWTLRPGWKGAVSGVDAVVFQGAWDTPAFWQILGWATRRKMRKVLFYESTLASMRHVRGPVARARAFFMRRMDVIVTPGEAASSAVIAQGIPPSSVVTSVNVVDVAGFRAAAVAAREDGGSKASGHVFVVVSRLIPRKRVDAVIRAFGAMAYPADRLLIVGDGPERTALEEDARVTRLEGSASIEFLGQLSERGVQGVYAEAQTLVLASSEEVWGLVVNEALAAGLHVVVTSCCGVAPSVSKMPGVTVTAADDDEALASAMAASRDQWRGWIDQPPILRHTGERLAGDISVALTRREGRWHARL